MFLHLWFIPERKSLIAVVLKKKKKTLESVTQTYLR